MGKLVTKKSRIEKTSPVRSGTKQVVTKQPAEKVQLTSNGYAQIKQLYSIVNGERLDFYRKNGWLGPALFALYPEINARFGKVMPQIIIHSDPEFSTWETLLITIPTKEKFETAQQKLDELVQNWVYNQSPEFKKTITLSIV